MTKTPALTVFTSETGRRYIDCADVAAICGVPGTDLDHKYRPLGFATPRDMRWDGKRLWFAVLSLPQLADALTAQGANDAALKLRSWATPWVEAALAEELARHPKTFDAGRAEAGFRLAETGGRHSGGASDQAAPSTAPATAARVVHKPMSAADAQAQWESIAGGEA